MEWLEHYGGYVNPSLTLAYSPTTGTRGLIANRRIIEDELKEGPLIVVPDSVQITAEAAQLRLEPLLRVCHVPSLKSLTDELQTSLLLAFEKRKGKRSFWASYIETLPMTPSCGWLLPENELRVELAFLPSSVRAKQDWIEQAKRYSQLQRDDVQEVVDEYGEVLEINHEDLLWALGQVHSRAYGKECALTPVIDLLNHNVNALPPLGYTEDKEDVPMTYVGSFLYGMPRPLERGDELFVNYNFLSSVSSLDLFLHFGFVPMERREEPQNFSDEITIP
eukprot:g2409.t1